MKILYKPYSGRTPDRQYKDVLRKILADGVRTPAQSGIDTITYMGLQMRFKVENGCPLITERNLAPERKTVPTIWRQAIGEITAFINGARTLEQIQSYGCHWWRYFTLDKKCLKRGLDIGDNGPGSYGPSFHDFPMPDGSLCNQVAEVLEQMKELPHLKTHVINPWIPYYTYRGEGKTQKVVVCPCHGWMHFRIMNGKLSLIMNQRSGDVPVGIPQNMVQYFALLLMFAQALDLEPYEFIHNINDAHIYTDQMKNVEEILGRKARPFPKLILNSLEKDVFKIRHTDFEIEEYDPHPAMKMAVTP